MTESAQCASEIRKELKTLFPGVAFTVRSSNFSMGDSVDVGWVDGPTDTEVGKVIKKYQYGSFDGMIDLYEYTNTRDDIPQAKYVQSNRNISKEAYFVIRRDLAKRFGIKNPESDTEWYDTFQSWASQVVYRESLTITL
jgi:hypothetical protein